ncbi:MAG TPA: Nif3-like dinuclear metal center hexameric protein [Bryobacteraceae bacterium]|jgi:putative NIF3 family GTP cyclohydrolase 1 type 2|nr:Nif3-like dinuclear metal center hexameric protein [Bryobacteraceae bacterium]
MTRRTGLWTATAAALAPRGFAQSAKGALTAGEVIDRIKANVGIPWREKTVDRIIAGTAETPVKGIATTMMATLDVLRAAVEAGANMVITHEPTFYSHPDTIDQIKDDEIYRYKLDFIAKNNLVSFHFHDHWHGHRPDGIATGMSRELGWEKFQDAQNPRLFTFPGVPLARLAQEIQNKLKIRTMRVVGDPKLVINHAIASWGNVSQFPGIPFLSRPDIDVLIIGETHEWELVEYAQDTISAGKKKALMILGHVVSEQSGMKYCAEWLRGFVTEVPVKFVPAAEPFWRPDQPVG